MRNESPVYQKPLRPTDREWRRFIGPRGRGGQDCSGSVGPGQAGGQITVSQEELRAIVQDEVDAQLSNPSEVVLARLDSRLSETDGYLGRELFNLRSEVGFLKGELANPGFPSLDRAELDNIQFQIDDLWNSMGGIGFDSAPRSDLAILQFDIQDLRNEMHGIGNDFASVS